MKYATTHDVKIRLTDKRWSRTALVVLSRSHHEWQLLQAPPCPALLGYKGSQDFMAPRLRLVQASQRSRASVCFDSFVHCNWQLPPALEGCPEGPLRAPSISGRPLYLEPSYFSQGSDVPFYTFFKENSNE